MHYLFCSLDEALFVDLFCTQHTRLKDKLFAEYSSNINPDISLSMYLVSYSSSPCGVISSNSTHIAFFIRSTVKYAFIHTQS